MSVTIKKNIITMTRGDTLRSIVSITDDDGNPYTPAEEDVIRFAMKRSFSDEEPLLVKVIPNDTMELHLLPEDTKNLDQPSEYVYDIQITLSNGDVNTFISSVLKIRQEVD